MNRRTCAYCPRMQTSTSLAVSGHLRGNEATFSTTITFGLTAVMSMTASTPMPSRRSLRSCTVAASDAG